MSEGTIQLRTFEEPASETLQSNLLLGQVGILTDDEGKVKEFRIGENPTKPWQDLQSFRPGSITNIHDTVSNSNLEKDTKGSVDIPIPWKGGEGENSIVAVGTEDLACTASGEGAVAHGSNTGATGKYSHAEGIETNATGDYSHAEGTSTSTYGYASHAEGYYAGARGEYSHAEGSNTVASGYASHAEGYTTVASGNYSHAEGSNTTAGYENQHVIGTYNKNYPDNIFEVGIGSSNLYQDNSRNGFAVSKYGQLQTTITHIVTTERFYPSTEGGELNLSELGSVTLITSGNTNYGTNVFLPNPINVPEGTVLTLRNHGKANINTVIDVYGGPHNGTGTGGKHSTFGIYDDYTPNIYYSLASGQFVQLICTGNRVNLDYEGGGTGKSPRWMVIMGNGEIGPAW